MLRVILVSADNRCQIVNAPDFTFVSCSPTWNESRWCLPLTIPHCYNHVGYRLTKQSPKNKLCKVKYTCPYSYALIFSKEKKSTYALFDSTGTTCQSFRILFAPFVFIFIWEQRRSGDVRLIVYNSSWVLILWSILMTSGRKLMLNITTIHSKGSRTSHFLIKIMATFKWYSWVPGPWDYLCPRPVHGKRLERAHPRHKLLQGHTHTPNIEASQKSANRFCKGTEECGQRKSELLLCTTRSMTGDGNWRAPAPGRSAVQTERSIMPCHAMHRCTWESLRDDESKSIA